MGCQTVSPPNSQDQKKAENLQEVQSALGVVAGAVAGKELSPEELKKLGQQIQSDPAVQSAVAEITDTLSVQPAVVKYCPLDGQRYAPELEYCPVHGVVLETLKE